MQMQQGPPLMQQQQQPPQLQPPRKPKRKRGRLVVISAAVVVVLLAIAAAAVRYLAYDNYYIAEGANSEVAIFQGVRGTILGVEVHRQVEGSCPPGSGASCAPLTVTQLKDPQRQSEIKLGVPVADLDSARATIAGWRAQDALPTNNCPPVDPSITGSSTASSNASSTASATSSTNAPPNGAQSSTQSSSAGLTSTVSSTPSDTQNCPR
jgi:protein phosphatase